MSIMTASIALINSNMIEELTKKFVEAADALSALEKELENLAQRADGYKGNSVWNAQLDRINVYKLRHALNDINISVKRRLSRKFY